MNPETQHQILVTAGVRWLKHRCSVVFAEFTTSAGESPDVIGWRNNISTLIECKASRPDFLADAKKIFRRYPDLGMGSQRYYLCPPDVITVKDLPDMWGLLWLHGRRIRVKRQAETAQRNSGSEITYLVSMLRRGQGQVRLGDQPLTEWLKWNGSQEIGKNG